MVVVQHQLVICKTRWEINQPHLHPTKPKLRLRLEHLILVRPLPIALSRWSMLEEIPRLPLRHQIPVILGTPTVHILSTALRQMEITSVIQAMTLPSPLLPVHQFHSLTHCHSRVRICLDSIILIA